MTQARGVVSSKCGRTQRAVREPGAEKREAEGKVQGGCKGQDTSVRMSRGGVRGDMEGQGVMKGK